MWPNLNNEHATHLFVYSIFPLYSLFLKVGIDRSWTINWRNWPHTWSYSVTPMFSLPSSASAVSRFLGMTDDKEPLCPLQCAPRLPPQQLDFSLPRLLANSGINLLHTHLEYYHWWADTFVISSSDSQWVIYIFVHSNCRAVLIPKS